MAKERLDQILLRKGLVTEEQIRQALLRQKSHRGPLGSHLMYYKYITEEDLVSTLAEQFGVQAVVLGRRGIPPEVIGKVPAAIADKYGVCPFAFDPETRTLSLAMLDPERTEAIYLVKDASGAWHVEPYVAAESVLRNAVRRHYHGASHEGSIDQIIELPDLFEDEGPVPDSDTSGEPSGPGEEPAKRKVLMVTRSPFLKGLLVSIFEREGFSLTVLGEKEDALAGLADCVYDHILVSEEMEATYREWIRTEELPPPRGEHSVFTSVSHALLDNPAPYHRMAASLVHALMELAESRCDGRRSRPPYERICKDAGDLAREVGLGRLAADGIQIASLLLCPSKSSGRNEGGGQPSRLGTDTFENADRSLESAKALCFPWDVFGCLSLFFRLLAGEPSDVRGPPEDPDLRLAVQILALVWHRHAALGRIEGPREEVLFRIREDLKRPEGIPPSPEVLEAYGRLLERRQGQTRAVVRKDVFIVRERSDAVRPLIAHLRREGYSIVEVKDLAEALHLHERRQPDAMVVHYDDFPDEATKLGRLVRSGSTTILYALTAQTKPSLIMSLLDAGFDDVFSPPLNYGVVCARITKALVAQEQQGAESREKTGFRGSFRELPFVDLVQALALSQRSCKIRLENRNGGRAEIYLHDGQMVFAECGELSGVEAVYAVIRWGEEGVFRIGPVSAYPETNISLPNDFVLMEGCRLLDEGSELQGSGTGDQGSGPLPA